MNEGITFVGLDGHKAMIAITVLLPGRKEPLEWQIVNETAAVRRMVRKIERLAPGEVRSCYEAGPLGFALQRQVEAIGKNTVCTVIAPSLIPVKRGDRVKTDRRDARKLAEFHQAGLLTEVCPPTEEDEAVRDLCRARTAAKADLKAGKHRVGKMLLRRGIVFQGGKRAWTQAHRRWLKGLRFEQAVDQVVFDNYLLAVDQHEERAKELERHMQAVSQQEPYARPVAWLRCFRGIDMVTALTLVAELHDFRRFDTASGLMGYLGLVPSEYSSAGKTKRGGITKTGNQHVRRLLVESSWHYRHRPDVGPALKKRREGQPQRVIAIADKAQRRLNRRYRRMTEGGKESQKAIVAVARELAGFIWAALRENENAVAA